MKDIFRIWKDTKGVVLIAFSASIYAASLIPFKPIVIIPGSTEIRPGAVFPVIMGIMFGPAGAWGSAIGNTIADFFGMFGPGTIPGFFGNFFYSYVPFLLWNRINFIGSEGSPNFKTSSDIVQFIFISTFSSLTCGLIIGWGVDMMGLIPLATITPIIFINNSLVSIILGPFLIQGLYHRVRKWGLIYDDFSERRAKLTLRHKIGAFLILFGIIGGTVAGYLLLFLMGSESHLSANLVIMVFLLLFFAGVMLF